MSLMRRHRESVLAAAASVLTDPAASAIHAAIAGGSALGRHLAAAAEAGDPGSPRMRALAGIMLQLKEDRDRLSAIQSVEAKVELKRELVGRYYDWCDGIMRSTAEGGAPIQDEVLANTMVWAIDAGEYRRALELAAYVLQYGLVLPERFDRTPAVLVAEQIAEAALSEMRAGNGFPGDVLSATHVLTVNHDMPDQVRAKLQKAIGLELASRVEDLGENGVAGAKMAGITAALAALRRAVQLNPQVGVKKEIDRLERELKAIPTPPAPEGEGGNETDQASA